MGDEQPAGERPRISKAGIGLGLVLTPLVAFAFNALLVPLLGGGIAVAVTAVACAAAAIVLLAPRRDPLWRGIGAGVLSGLALMLLLFGACFAFLVQLEPS